MTPGIVVVGSINQDVALHVARAPRPGETVLASAQTVSFGGKGANQAIAAARSIAAAGDTAAVTFVGAVGDDPAGLAARRNLADAGIDTGNVRVCEQPTGSAYVTVATTGENSIVVVPGANASLTAADLDRAVDVLGAAAVVVLQLEIPLPVVERAAEAVGAVILNAAPARPLPAALLAKVAVLIVNEGEADTLLEGGASSDVDTLTGQLRALGPASVVGTLGERGAAWRTADSAGSVPVPPVDVVDTTGAGDAFIGAFAAAYLHATDPPRGDPATIDPSTIDPSTIDPPTINIAVCVEAGVRLASAATTVRGAQVPAQLLAGR